MYKHECLKLLYCTFLFNTNEDQAVRWLEIYIYILDVLLYKMYEQMNIVTALQAYIKVELPSWDYGMVILF